MAWINISKGNYDVSGTNLRANILNTYKVVNIIDTGNERNFILCD